jgi:pimeloyl-ACP methyl ester carboxylesterase
MPNWLIYTLITVPAVIIGIFAALYYFQEFMVFHPEILPFEHEYKFDQPFEERNFVMDKGVVLNALHFKNGNPKGLIFYVHGNAGNLDGWGQRAEHFTRYGYDVFMYDFRTYGKSTGRIKNERMMHREAKTLYAELLREYAESDIVVYGTSLGTGIATQLAANQAPKLLLLETPYYNFYQVARYHYPYIPNSVILKYNFNTNKHIVKVKCPVNLFHGTSDVVIPYESSERLVALSPNIKLFTFEKGLHSNLATFDEYHEALEKVLT